MTRTLRPLCLATCMLTIVVAVPIGAQAPAAPAQGGRGGGRGAQQPQVASPEVTADRRIVFRIVAPQATAVRLSASDIPAEALKPAQLVKKDNGVWEGTTGQVPAGAYRYNFNIDGVATIDPRNPLTSESQNNTWSLVSVPGADFLDTRQVPHGNVAEVNYYSTALKADRRMHVYMPPGYETSNRKYPVFYLLHGAGDSDDSWSTVGRAGFILDNLINEKKAKPMIVVMPAGHTRGPAAPIGATNTDAFVADFVTDIMPYVQKTYRVQTDRASTALAGLSMGGLQTLNIGIPNLEKFGYLGVYSSGLIGGVGGGRGRGRGGEPAAAAPPAPAAAPATTADLRAALNAVPAQPPQAPAGPTEWETRNASKLDDANLKKGLKLFWFSTGKDDFLLDTTVQTVAMLKKHGFNVVYKESAGGHTWLNWRDYLNEFAPQLFQ